MSTLIQPKLLDDEITENNLSEILYLKFQNLDIYNFSNGVNEFIKQCQQHMRNELIQLTLETLANFEFYEESEFKYINFFDTFQFLLTSLPLQTSCDIMKLFLTNNYMPCEKSFLKIIQTLLSQNVELSQILSLVLLALQKSKLGSQTIQNILDNYLVFNNIEACCEILNNVPLNILGVISLWNMVIEKACSQQIIEDLIKSIDFISDKNLPSFKNEVENIHNEFLTKLQLNNLPQNYISQALQRMIDLQLNVNKQILRKYFDDVIETNMNFEDLIQQIDDLSEQIDASIMSIIIKALIKGNRRNDVIQLLEYCNTKKQGNYNIKNLELNLLELQCILILQNQLAMQIDNCASSKNFDQNQLEDLDFSPNFGEKKIQQKKEQNSELFEIQNISLDVSKNNITAKIENSQLQDDTSIIQLEQKNQNQSEDNSSFEIIKKQQVN